MNRAGRNTHQVRRNFIFQRVIRLLAAITTLSSSRRSTRDTLAAHPSSFFPPSPRSSITMACVQLSRRRQVPIYKYKRIVHTRSLRHTLQESSNNIPVRGRGGTSAPQLNRGDVSRIQTPTFEYPETRLKFQNFSGIPDARQTNYDKFSTARAVLVDERTRENVAL